MAGQNFDLQAAQSRLEAIRLARRIKRSDRANPASAGSHGRSPAIASNRLDLSRLPAHLGWGSARVTAVLRRRPQQSTSAGPLPEIKPVLTPPPPSTKPAGSIKLYPDLALAMLRNHLAATGRIWLLLRHLDTDGRGWLTDQTAREMLSEKPSPWRVCGWRQLRNLLRQGDGIFWQRRDGRLWLKSTAKTAAALGVYHLTSQPVAIPPKTLTKKIGAVRAQLYASFHSGRKAAPIARETIGRMSGITPRTQRSYEAKSKIITQTNFAIGPQASPDRMKSLSWQRGNGVFPLLDKKGCQGKPGIVYLAWQMPNSFHGPHVVLPRGRQKRINRELADLFTQGMTGNGRIAVDSPVRTRRYYQNGRAAALAKNKRPEVYWRSPVSRGVWYCLDT